jgi:hypothetical protein
VQAIHLYHREVSRIVEDVDLFDGVRIHFQGPKLHALFFRPIDSRAALATKAVLLQLVLRQFVGQVFNPAFPKLPALTVAGGADLGNAIGTKNGMDGDRELLFLGAPANYAAKIIGAPGQIRATEGIFSALPERLRRLCHGMKGITECAWQRTRHSLRIHSRRSRSALTRNRSWFASKVLWVSTPAAELPRWLKRNWFFRETIRRQNRLLTTRLTGLRRIPKKTSKTGISLTMASAAFGYRRAVHGAPLTRTPCETSSINLLFFGTDN